MKLSKYAGIVKREAYCAVYHVETGPLWLGTRAAIYKAAGLPDFHGSEQAMAILDLTQKQMDKVYLTEHECEGQNNVCGYDLRDGYGRGEVGTKRMKMSAAKYGCACSALQCDDGELVFYDEGLLAPLADVMKDSDYAEMRVRRMGGGQQYIVVSDGFEVLACIMPMKVIDKEFLTDLAEFESMCIRQFERDNERAIWQPAKNDSELDVDGGQTEMSEAEETE